MKNEHYEAGMVLSEWIDPRLEVRPSPIAGTGLFALEPIQAGETLMVWGGTVYTQAEIEAGKADPETIGILDDGLYIADPAEGPAPEDYGMNHSCEPNVWMDGALTLTAMRLIAKDEELTADYAMWLYEQTWTLEKCNCGSALCRGRITSEDWKQPELQERYEGHFTPYLNKRIQAARNARK